MFYYKKTFDNFFSFKMRNYFAKSLFEIAKKDKRIILLSGDIGNRLFDKYKKNFQIDFLMQELQSKTWLELLVG